MSTSEVSHRLAAGWPDDGPVGACISPECMRGACGPLCDAKSPGGSADTNPCEHNCHPAMVILAGAEPELDAIRGAYRALALLDHRAQRRAIVWLRDKLGVHDSEPF